MSLDDGVPKIRNKGSLIYPKDLSVTGRPGSALVEVIYSSCSTLYAPMRPPWAPG
jgi:hypothetical protein